MTNTKGMEEPRFATYFAYAYWNPQRAEEHKSEERQEDVTRHDYRIDTEDVARVINLFVETVSDFQTASSRRYLMGINNTEPELRGVINEPEHILYLAGGVIDFRSSHNIQSLSLDITCLHETDRGLEKIAKLLGFPFDKTRGSDNQCSGRLSGT